MKKEKNYNSSYKYYCSCGDGVIRYVVYEKRIKKEELPQEEKKVEEIVWITESSLREYKVRWKRTLNALVEKTWM